MHKFTVIIPARFASTRLPGKPLLTIGNKALVHHVVDKAHAAGAERVVVATDDKRIEDYVLNYCQTAADGNSKMHTEVVMTNPAHENGTARIAEAIDILNLADDTALVNVQGDEPFISPEAIRLVATSLLNDAHANISTLKEKIENIEQYNDINVAKVLTDKNNYALYFSRSCIPNISRNPQDNAAPVFKHIGIYGYRADYVKRYANLPISPLEVIESLEQLRALYHGDKIIVSEVSMPISIGVDTPEDLAAANKFWRENNA